MLSFKTWLGCAGIAGAGLALAGTMAIYWSSQYGLVRQHYLAASSDNARFVGDKVETAFAAIYQNIRTVSLLPSMDNSAKIRAACVDIDKLESEADHVMRAAMAKLFRDEPDVRQVIKLKAIYELLEQVTDRCEDVANIIEGIVVENA